jgi:ribonuclease HI
MTKFQNSKFSVGPKASEKFTDVEWDIAVGLRCPTCTSKFAEGTKCSNPLCGMTVLANQLDEAAPVLTVPEFAAETRERKMAIGHFDGGSSNNPGLGASAWALEYTDGSTVTGVNGLGVTTNNRAEYDGLIHLLEYALEHGVRRMRVYGDSTLIINQTKGEWKVKDTDLKPLAARAKELVAKFQEIELIYIPREENTQCDALVKQTIKEQK